MKILLSKTLLLTAAVSFFGIANAQSNSEIIKSYLKANKMQANYENFAVANEDYSASMKGTVVEVQQTIDNIPVFQSDAKVLIKAL